MGDTNDAERIAELERENAELREALYLISNGKRRRPGPNPYPYTRLLEVSLTKDEYAKINNVLNEVEL